MSKSTPELLRHLIRDKKVEKTVTFQSGKSSATINYTLPAGAKIVSVSLARRPNADWITADINAYGNSSCVLSYNNTYNGSLSGTVELDILYRL